MPTSDQLDMIDQYMTVAEDFVAAVSVGVGGWKGCGSGFLWVEGCSEWVYL